MKTSKQQLLAMLRHRLLPKRSRRATGWHVLMLMLALLIGGSPQARAEQPSFDFTGTDAGGGNYRCHGESDYFLVSGTGNNNYAYFETKDKFNINNDQFYWGFHVKVNQDYFPGHHWGRNLNNQSISTFLYEGEIYLVTSDGTKHLVETWKKDYLLESYTHIVDKDNRWGKVWVSNIEDNNVQVTYAPSTKAFEDGVKRIVMKQTVSWKYNGTSDDIKGDAGWIEYEKDITLSGLETEKPMPKLSADWGDGGMLTFKAAGVPDKRSNDSYDAQGYNMNLYYHYDNDNKSSRNNTFTTADGSAISYTNETNGKMDMAYSYWPLTPSADKAKGAYTVPVFVEYRGITKPNDSDTAIPSGHTLSQPWADGFFVEPFTRPKSVSVEFDKWNKKNVVTWTRQDEATGYNGNKEQSVACRYDGKWYVIRYAKGGSATDYTLVKTLNGDDSSLKLTDEGIEYNKDYTYRVIFLPSVLENKYREDLAQLPGYGNGSTPTDYDLWNEASISNKLEIPITLSHDKSETDKIHLTWEYNIPQSGLKWSVESRAAGSSNSWSEEQQLSLDPNKHTAEVRLAGSACDPKEYRVSVVVSNTQFCSDILGASLPSSTYISDLSVTTGTEEQKVVVAWKVESPDREHDIYYRVLRRIVGESDWVTLSSSKHGTFSEYEYTDDRAQAGTYYEYAVQAFGALCDEQLKQSDMIIKPGFSQARGTITGHIAYGSGTAVEGVRVNLVKASTTDDNQPQYFSRRIDGDGTGLQWRADGSTYESVLNGQQPLTLQLWARPQSTAAGGASQQQLLQIAGALEIGVKESGGRFHLYAIDRSKGGTTEQEFQNLVFDNIDFTHVAAVYSGGTWTFYTGTESLQKATMAAAATTWNAVSSTTATLPTLSIGGLEATRTQGNGFKGHVDDVRLWKRALSEDEITENYARILGGTEQGMVLYWPLDEGLSVKHYAFDIACQDGLYQLNHPEVGANVLPDANSPQRLKLYGMTDSKGNYIIKGIPFQSGGTNYEVSPMMGIHEFSPGTRSMFVSPTSLTANNIDFEDVSSFPMKGKVHYVDTNIPVEGAILYVDGQPQSKDGKLIQTDDEGRYEVSVPIGEHFVEVRLDNHTMVGGGRFPLTGRYNFADAVNYNFQDSTLVNFVGRVAGGERNDSLGVGFGYNERIVGRPSVNNIGVATITLKVNSEKLSFNCKTGTTETHQQNRTWASDTVSVNSHTHTGFRNGEDHYIFIHTDSVTGEFSALLPPLKYTVKSIKVESNKSANPIEFTELPEIDMTSARNDVHTDSVLTVLENSADTAWVKYSYNTKMVKTYFAPPQLVVTQQGSKAFGEQEMLKYPLSNIEQVDIKDIWVVEADGSIYYTYKYPVFARNKEYKFDVRGYELYTNYDQGTDKAVNDTIALNGLLVTVTNEMSNTQDVVAKILDASQTGLKPGDIPEPKRTQMLLDKEGRNTVTFTTGFPNVTYPYTRRYSMTFERKNRTYSGQQFDGVVFGELTNGDNFVTAGPDHVDMVLRDPPGAKSKVTWKSGTSHTKLTRKASGNYGEVSVEFENLFGSNLETVNGGLGFAIVSNQKAEQTLSVGLKTSWTSTTNRDTTYVNTTAENISSSTGSRYVGAKGDVFIGKSHNLIVGTCRKLGFHREAGRIVIGLKESVAVNDEFKTDFVYTTREIEETMIPKLIDTRNSLLEYMEEADAKSYENNTDQDVYLTWKKPGEEGYGEEGTYVWKQGKNGKSQDMVNYYNSSVSSWKERLSENEQDKIEAMAARDKYLKENRSFDGGTSYTYSERRDSTWAKTENSSSKGGIASGFKFGVGTNIAASWGLNMIIKAEVGGIDNSVKGDSLDNKHTYAELDYELNDGNNGTDFSVDILRSPRGWGDIFVLRGGQSYNPYEGEELAQYYEPEKKHVISYGTEQMEQPVIRVSTDGKVGATSATLNDIPAGGTGQFTLHLTNGTTAHQTYPFTYLLDVAEKYNQQGLEVLMDGVPANGRGVMIPAGETVKKVITVRQTDQSVLDYEGVVLWFESQYQPAKIYDECKLNVHFVPSSSPVELAIDEPVVNSNTPGGELQMRLKGFNRQFKNLRNVGVQYRFQGSTQWTDLHTWWVNENDTIGRDSLSHKLLPKTGDLRLALDMTSNLAYPEGNYEFRAFTTTPYGTEMVHVYSDVAAVIKDRTLPINLYTPAPANGILGYGDQMAIEFNEDIVPGYVGGDNVVVTAKLNSSEVHHDVAYRLLPYEEMMPRTTNPVFLTSSFAMDFWLNWHEAGTILHLGKDTDNFALSIGDDGYVTVTMGNNTYRSDAAVPKDSWTFFALNYDTEKKVFNMLALQGTDNIYLFTDEPVSMDNVQAVHYLSDNCLYLGPVEADIHSLGLYNYCRDLSLASEDKYNAKDGYVYGLANFWPMDEGHGTVAADLRHTHDFEVEDLWTLENENYGLRINKPEGAMADISQVGTGPGESYAIEMWYNKSGNPKGETVFETATPDPYSPKANLNEVTNLHLRFDSLQNLVLDYGGKSQVVASHKNFPELVRYHHYALNVVRGQAASFYLDGQRTAVIPEADVPPIEGSRLIVGRNNEILAYADEIRIWHAALSESRLLSNMYNTLDTADVYSRGLAAYYPFEKTGVKNGVTTKVSTMENMAPGRVPSGSSAEMLFDAGNLFQHTPPLKNAPDETVLTATPVASDRKVVINLSMVGLTARQLEGTTLNITVDKVRDLHGNESQPIRWTAYVQQNTLKWTRDSVNVIKKYGEDYTFDVDIENKSGSTEYYTLYNMPQWLTVVGSSTSDDIAPLRTKTLRFRVNPLVPVGNYDATIGLQGNNGILEPMRIVMKVRGERPQWAVDPTKYEHQMSIVGQVYINGILMENAESMVAAFIGDECRGVASPERVRGAAYVTMTVYGKDIPAADMGKTLNFRIWDATQGVAYTDAQIAVDGSPIDIVFSQDKMLGNFDKPVIWTKSENVEQLIPIHQNWNWIAFGVEPKSTYLDHVFGAYAEWSMLIKSRSAVNDYNGAEWGFGTLKRAKANEMYKLKIDRLPTTKQEAPNSLLAVSGRQLKENKERAVMLGKGWNWIAYTPLTTMTVDEALAAANPQKGDIVKSQTGVALYGDYGWEGSLKALESGRGYLYYSNANDSTSFLYPTETAASAAKARRAAQRRAPEDLRIFKPVALGLYPSNMTMTIHLIAVDGLPVDTCEVAAFIGDECRGATRASENGLYYLVISGDGAGQSMTLRTCLNGEIIDIDNTQMYVSDANIGTSWEPYVIDLSGFTGIRVLDGSAVEDDSDWWTLQGFKIGRKPTRPGVYIHRGEQVTIKRAK
ncbi:MAG: hypothetical protein IJ533_10310 [Prevotella sp.]|nr:hypothetical protein [Prevotella sp.]MBQ8488024.1 hypothetical protein [Prevotella sp.]